MPRSPSSSHLAPRRIRRLSTRDDRRTAPLPARSLGGRHELGQNLLFDRRFPAAMADILRHAPPRPVLELGAGNGAVTEALLSLNRPVTAVELDPRLVAQLRRRFGPRVDLVEADLLTVDHPAAHDVVSNVPFGITTPLLRRLLPQRSWQISVLLLQWEVARKRAGVGGTTMLTAAWWPWYEFALDRRVPAAAFAPPPAVDGGILVIRRRDRPLVDPADRQPYQQLVRDVFTGRGRGLHTILRARLRGPAVERWLVRHRVDARQLPRDLTAPQWADMWTTVARDDQRPPAQAGREQPRTVPELPGSVLGRSTVSRRLRRNSR